GREAREGMQLRPHAVGREEEEMHLDVRRRQRRIGAEEGAGGAGADGERAAPQERVIEAGARLAVEAAEMVVEGAGLPALEDHADLEVVLQVAADAGHLVQHRDAMLLQELAGADAGKLQQLRRVEGAAREDDLALGAGAAERATLAELDPG